MRTLILTGGGSAGHVTPNLALLPELKKRFDKIVYIGSKDGIEEKLAKSQNLPFYPITTVKLERKFTAKNLLIPIKLAKGISESKKLLKQLNPSAVFSKGGYCALPPCLAAFNLKIPVITHESDLSLGLANKLIAKKCNALLTTFKESGEALKNAYYVGPLLREEFFNKNKAQSKRSLGINNDKPVLLVTGGSQGSKIINEALKVNIDEILRHFNVIHLYGKQNKPIYNAINGYFGFSFADMPTAISACDMAISRGGSNTLFELVCTSTPSLIIPLKKASRGDQIKNAQYFASKNTVLTADENELEKNLLPLIHRLYNQRQALITNMKNLNLQNGASKTVEIILQHAKKHPI